MKRVSLLTAALAFILFGAMSTSAQAGFLVGGNTSPSGTVVGVPGAAVDGTISVAVFTQSAFFGGPGPVGDVFGTGLPGFDAAPMVGTLDLTVDYLYLFVAANDGVLPASISTATVGLSLPSDATSFGYWPTLGLFDTGDATPVAAFTPLGTAVAPGPVNGVAPLNFGGPAKVVAAAGISPTSITKPGSVAASFSGLPLTFGTESVIWGYTSKYFPTIQGASIIDHGASGTGLVLGPLTGVLVPVPATAVLLLSLCPLIGIAVLRRRRKTA